MKSETMYVRSGDLHIAYRILGSGPPDVVLVPNWITDVEATPDVPVLGGALIARLASFTRLVIFDQPGTGHSDPVAGELPSLETYVDSIRVVMDTARIERASLLGWDLAVPAALMFAASHPARTLSLVLLGGTARWWEDQGYPGLSEASRDEIMDNLLKMWGTPDYARFLAPSMAHDEQACEELARWLRHALSPGMARRVLAMGLDFDVRSILPLVVAPTLIMHPSASSAAPPVDQARYLADHLSDVRLEIYDSKDILPFRRTEVDWLTATVQEFLTGIRPPAHDTERALATLLFTDFVSSTNRAATMGDAEWRSVLERHDAVARKEVDRFRGRLIKSTGDGILATFDGPARAIRCAQAIALSVKRFGIDMRSGVHTGEVELIGNDIGGIAVHIAARVMSLAEPGEVLVSSTVKDLVTGSDLEFEDRGRHALKGVPHPWQVYVVRG